MKTKPRITDVDISVYYMLHEAVVLAPYTLAKSVPTFIINESIWFFERREEYEKCDDIKSFFDQHPELLVACSRKQYMDYGWNTIK